MLFKHTPKGFVFPTLNSRAINIVSFAYALRFRLRLRHRALEARGRFGGEAFKNVGLQVVDRGATCRAGIVPGKRTGYCDLQAWEVGAKDLIFRAGAASGLESKPQPWHVPG